MRILIANIGKALQNIKTANWRQRCSIRKGVFKNSKNFTGKEPVLESVFNKIYEKDSRTVVFR